MELELSRGTLRRCRTEQETIVLPEGIHTIGDWAFYGNRTLRSIELPDSVRRIGNFAFERCSALTAIRMPASVQAMGEGVFSGCARLKRLSLPEGTRRIGIPFLKECKELGELSVPDTAEEIAARAFSDCVALRRLHIRLRLLQGVPEEIRRIAVLTAVLDKEKTRDRLTEHALCTKTEELAEYALERNDLEALSVMHQAGYLDQALCRRLLDRFGQDGGHEALGFLMEYGRKAEGKSGATAQAQDEYRL